MPNSEFEERRHVALEHFNSRAPLVLEVLDLTVIALDKNTDSETKALTTTLSRLLVAAHKHVKRTQVSVTNVDDGDLVVWSARTLLEIYIWVRYILSSEEALRTFNSDTVVDQFGYFDALTNWIGSSNSPNQKTVASSLQSLVNTIRPALVPRRWLTLSEAAKGLNCETEFRARYKIYSKLLHVTAWSTDYPYAAAEGHACEVASYGLRIIHEVHRYFHTSPASTITHSNFILEATGVLFSNPQSPGSIDSAP
jgi:hypothetical protein